MTEHLNLGHLTSFAARYHLATSVRAQRQTENDAKLLKLIEDEANALTVKKIGLAENFAELRASIKRQRRRFRPGITPGFADSLDKLLASLRAHSCGKCEGVGNEKKCKHGEATYGNVSIENGGQCIAPLKGLFNDLRCWVDGLWRDLPPSTNMPSLPILFATTSRSFDNCQPIIEKFHVSGFAWSVCDINGDHTKAGNYYTKVGLEILEDSFGWPQYNLLPYVLLHEILCHAFQSLDNPPLRPNAEPSDAWSEGWMDCVAYELAVEWLEKHEKTPFTAGEYRDAQRQTFDLHNARYPKKPAAEGIPDQADGRSAFYEVLGSYPKPYRNLSRTKHPVTLFSLWLNAITRPPEQRVRDLVKFQHLAKNDPAELHAMIGAFNAAADEPAAIEILERVAP